MRERDRLSCWQQILTQTGIHRIPEAEWQELARKFMRSWDGIYYLQFDKRAGKGASAGAGRQDATAPAGSAKRGGTDMAPPSAVSPHKRRNSMAPSVSPTKRRNSTAPSVFPTKRRNSMAPSVSPTKRLYPKGQTWDSPKRRKSVAAHGCDSIRRGDSMADLLRSPIKGQPAVTPPAFDMMEEEFNSLEHSVPIVPISPLATSPILGQDSATLNRSATHRTEPFRAPTPHRRSLPDTMAPPDHMAKCKMLPSSSTPKRRDSTIVSASANAKSKSCKPSQKPQSVVTGSDDDLEEEMSLSAWKAYNAKVNAQKPKPLSPQKLDPPVKRKRGRPSREELAKRLEEEQELKMTSQALGSFKAAPEQKLSLNQKPIDEVPVSPPPTQAPPQPQEEQREATKAPQKHTKKQKHSKKQKHPKEQPQPSKSSKSPSKSPKKQQPAAKPRCQSASSSISDQEGAHIEQPPNMAFDPDTILDEEPILAAHMPEMAMDLKCQKPRNEEKKKEQGEEQEEEEEDNEDIVRLRPNPLAMNRQNAGSRYRSIYGDLSSDEDEEELIRNQTDFMMNDPLAEDQLIDDAMELTSPVGGGEGDKDELDLDLDIDVIVRDENVSNQMALIDPQEAMAIDRCLEAIEAQRAPSVETRSEVDPAPGDLPEKAPSETNDRQLGHSVKFFEELAKQPKVDVNAYKSDLLWPFLEDDDDVLDYEADNDVLTLAISSDELEDVDEPKEVSKPSGNTQARRQSPVEPPKSTAKPEIPKPEAGNKYRIPKVSAELLKAQPAVMHSLYEQMEQEQEEREQERERSTAPSAPPAPSPLAPPPAPQAEEIRQRREEARAARRPQETLPRFAPPYRRPSVETPEFGPDDTTPMFGHADPTPMFGPEDLAPIVEPPWNTESLPEESLYGQPNVPMQAPPTNRVVPPQEQHRHPSVASQYVPENLGANNRDPPCPPTRTSSYQTPPATNWMMEVFGVKCLHYLNNNCQAVSCDHSMSTVGEVETRLFNMKEHVLVNTYRQALRSYYIAERYLKSFADIFERRKLWQHLLQMLTNCRLYRTLALPLVGHIFWALQRNGMEREATSRIMTDLWMPHKAHKFPDLTRTILEILTASNWKDYIDQLMELHKTYKFWLPVDLLISIIRWADVTKNETLQKVAIMMPLDDMATYNRSTTLVSLISKYSGATDGTNANPKRASPGSSRRPSVCGQQQQQEQQYPAANWTPGAGAGPSRPWCASVQPQPQQYSAPSWSHNHNSNDRLPGAAPGPSPMRSASVQPQYAASNWNHNQNYGPSFMGNTPAREQQQQQQQQHQYPASNWNQNPNPNLPGAGPGPSLIRSDSAAGQQQQHQYRTPNWNHNNTNPNLPGAFLGQPLIRTSPGDGQQQCPATNWNQNPNPNLPGAAPGPSLIQPQYPAAAAGSNWGGQANNSNRANHNQFRHYPPGFE